MQLGVELAGLRRRLAVALHSDEWTEVLERASAPLPDAQ